MNAPATISLSRIADVVGAPNVITEPQALAAYSVDGLVPQIAARPASAQEVSELVKFAAAEKLAVIPTGARTKLGIGMPPSRYDLAIDMTRLDRVISYDPGDLTLSGEPGIPLARLAKVLAEHNQFLPLAVPFYDSATVGGTLASGVDSPLRHFYGTARDFVLGMEFVSGDGALTKSGGRVVKNVSGYDLHKLFLGSIGSLGVITRINFKTFPLPPARRGFVASFNSLDAALDLRKRIAASPISPATLEIVNSEMAHLLFPADANASSAWHLLAGLSGSPAVLDRCTNDLCSMAGSCGAKDITLPSDAEYETLSSNLREAVQSALRSFPASIVLKLSVISSDVPELIQLLESQSQSNKLPAAILIRGVGVIYCAIGLESTAALEQTHSICQSVLSPPANNKPDFRATVLACPLELKRQLNIWGPPREDFILHQRVKRAFDPHNIFAPGRFVGGL